MNEQNFKRSILLSAFVFLIVLLSYTLPAAIELGDTIAAFSAGFVNPFATGYSTDVISCWFILTFWILYERTTLKLRHGWVCALLGIFPGVAVGFALYLLLRLKQLPTTALSEA